MHDDDLDIPAQQWTNTTPPEAKAFLINITAFMKWAPRFSHGTSFTYSTLYLNSFGNGGFIPPNAWRICVTPFAFNAKRLLAPLISPRYIPSII